MNGGSALAFRLVAANLVNVAAAHIHLAPADQNGPVVVLLFPLPGAPIPGPGRFSGVLSEGTITASDLVGQLAGMTIADLVARFEAGQERYFPALRVFPWARDHGLGVLRRC